MTEEGEKTGGYMEDDMRNFDLGDLGKVQSAHAEKQEADEQQRLRQAVPDLNKKRDELLQESKVIQDRKDKNATDDRRIAQIRSFIAGADKLIGEAGEKVAPEVVQRRDAAQKKLESLQQSQAEAGQTTEEIDKRLRDINEEMTEIESNPYVSEVLDSRTEQEGWERGMLESQARKMFRGYYGQFASLSYGKSVEIKNDPAHNGETKRILVNPANEFVDTLCRTHIGERIRNEGVSAERAAREELDQLGNSAHNIDKFSDLKQLLGLHGTLDRNTMLKGGTKKYAKEHPVSLNYVIMFYQKMNPFLEGYSFRKSDEMLQALPSSEFEITEEGFALPKDLSEKERKELINILKGYRNTIDGYVDGLNHKDDPVAEEEPAEPKVEKETAEEEVEEQESTHRSSEPEEKPHRSLLDRLLRRN